MEVQELEIGPYVNEGANHLNNADRLQAGGAWMSVTIYRGDDPKGIDGLSVSGKAIVDPGANASGFLGEFLDQIGIIISPQKGTSTGWGGSHECEFTSVQIQTDFLDTRIPLRAITIIREKAAEDFKRNFGKIGAEPPIGIIGRDFLRDFKMVYDGFNGKVTLDSDIC